MDLEAKNELLAAMRTNSEEIKQLVSNCINDHTAIRSSLASLAARVEALEAHRGACDGRHNAHEQTTNADRKEIAESLVKILSLLATPDKDPPHALAT